MGRNFRDQAAALEAGRADVIEVAPEQAHRLSQSRASVASSPPIELMALVFARDCSSSDEKLLREALGLSIERGSIHNVLLQGAGQPAGSLLPTWVSGFGFVFPSDADLQKARRLRGPVETARVWTVGYDANDPLARVVVERIALNAKDAGLSLVPSAAGTTDLRLMRIPLTSSNPWISLEGVAAQTGLPKMRMTGESIEELFTAEQASLANERVIPLFHLPTFYAASLSLRSWVVRSDGSLDLARAWLGGGK